MRRHTSARAALRELRRRLGPCLPVLIYWRAMNDKYNWTLFARNGRIVAASSEDFSSITRARGNFECVSDMIFAYRKDARRGFTVCTCWY